MQVQPRVRDAAKHQARLANKLPSHQKSRIPAQAIQATFQPQPSTANLGYHDDLSQNGGLQADWFVFVFMQG